MSQENVEVVRRCFEAWDRGDVDAVVREYAADVEVDMPPARVFCLVAITPP